MSVSQSDVGFSKPTQEVSQNLVQKFLQYDKGYAFTDYKGYASTEAILNSLKQNHRSLHFGFCRAAFGH